MNCRNGLDTPPSASSSPTSSAGGRAWNEAQASVQWGNSPQKSQAPRALGSANTIYAQTSDKWDGWRSGCGHLYYWRSILSLMTFSRQQKFPNDQRRMNTCVITRWLAIMTARWPITVAWVTRLYRRSNGCAVQAGG